MQPDAPFSCRVIVADDHEWIREILGKVVRQTLPGVEVMETNDGFAALREFQRAGCDFLVTNHSMPHMDGDELVREVRKLSPEVPILMVSLNPAIKTLAMDSGANWFLAKDEIIEEMPKLLLRHVRLRP